MIGDYLFSRCCLLISFGAVSWWLCLQCVVICYTSASRKQFIYMTSATCLECGALFVLSAQELAFLSKTNIPARTKCFVCSQKQRLSFRNSSALYNRKCDYSGESIISVYSSDKPYTVYKSDYWFSDKWDALRFGQEIDFARPFFPQLKELQLKVPRLALLNFTSENSDYCNCTVGNKNCYLVFGGDFNENCMYGNLSMHNKSVFDTDFSSTNELCYMLSDCTNCYDCQFVFDSKSCSSCAYVSDSSNCRDCILCTNLSNAQYCFGNQQLTKEAYEAKKHAWLDGSYAKQQQLVEEFRKLRSQRIVKYAHIVSSEQSSGDYLKSCQSCLNCFDATESQDLGDVIFANKARDVYNSSMLGDDTELGYEVISTVGAYNSYFSYGVLHSSNVHYCDMVLNSNDLFGCVGVQKQSYCILNKQYSKEDFIKLQGQLIEHMKRTGEWGQPLPKELSCFGYNESCAQEYYPLTAASAAAQGYAWYERDQSNSYQGPIIEISDQIADVVDTITKEILTCASCQKNYRVIPAELQFYRDHQLPVPHQCHICRYNFRQTFRNPRVLWTRQCASCHQDVQTTYAADRQETVYCERCFLAAVYQ